MKKPISKLLHSVEEVMESTGLGRTQIYEELNSRRLIAVKVGKRTLITNENLQKWIAGLDQYGS